MIEAIPQLVEGIPRLEIPAAQEFLAPSLEFILSYAAQLGMGFDRRLQLRKACEVAISLVMKNNISEQSEVRIGIDAFELNGYLTIEVLNRGVPLFLDGEEKAREKLHLVSQYLDKVSIENRGRQGQTLVLGMRLGSEAIQKSINKQILPRENALELESEIEIREVKLGEENLLSQLFYSVYGYKYINDFVYYPDKIRKMLEEKKLISIVAVHPSGRLVAHVGLLKWNNDPLVYEPCLGAVDPLFKSRGIFGTVFQRTMEMAKTISMQYCFFDFVTNHDYSQRLVNRYGMKDLALFVGCQSKDTQAQLAKLGLGEDPKEMDRYSLLLSIIPIAKEPFGREVLLPGNLGELLGFLLKPLNISWSPAPRFQLLKPIGQYEVQIQPAQNAVIFDMFDPGRKAASCILAEWQQLLRSGYQYAGIDVPIDAPGLGNLYDILSEQGFFVAGFIPYHHSNKLGFRFQSIGPTKVAFDEIKVCTENGKRLLEIVRNNYERNGFV